MQKVWIFLREPLNLTLIIAIVSGLGWLWHEFRPLPKTGSAVVALPDRKIGEGDQTAIAKGNNSHAINAGSDAVVTISGDKPN